MIILRTEIWEKPLLLTHSYHHLKLKLRLHQSALPQHHLPAQHLLGPPLFTRRKTLTMLVKVSASWHSTWIWRSNSLIVLQPLEAAECMRWQNNCPTKSKWRVTNAIMNPKMENNQPAMPETLLEDQLGAEEKSSGRRSCKAPRWELPCTNISQV